jgi:serine/threonine protein kinase
LPSSYNDPVRQVLDTRYHTNRPLGSGGMADVYLAHDEVLNRDVALKILSRRCASDNGLVERFRSEARSAASLSHPNIVSIYDRGETEDGTYYIVMEYVPGGTLKECILRKGPLSPNMAAAVATQVAEALEEAHRNGVIHRDIKPQNILITDWGDVKVADFGIARAASSSTATETGWIMGTAHYVSPEQVGGEPVSPRSDLYSLGVVLYEMLTGELPYDAESPIGIAMQHVEGRLRPPREVDPSIPEGINAVAVRLLAKDPKDRHPDATSLLEDLDRIKEGLKPSAATMRTLAKATLPQTTGMRTSTQKTRIEAPPPLLHQKEKQRQKIFPWIIAVALLAASVLTGTVGLSFWQSLQEWTSPPILEAPDPIKVPDVTGRSLEVASGMLQDVGLSVDQEHRTVESDKPEGTVLSTDPSAGSEVEADTSVTLTVSRGAPKKKTAEPTTNTPTNSSAPKVTTMELNTLQPAPAPAPASNPAPQQPAPAPAPASNPAPQQPAPAPAPASNPAPQQPAPEQSTQNQEPVLQSRNEPQESAKEKVEETLERAQERAQEQIDRIREDRE